MKRMLLARPQEGTILKLKEVLCPNGCNIINGLKRLLKTIASTRCLFDTLLLKTHTKTALQSATQVSALSRNQLRVIFVTLIGHIKT